MDPSLFPWLFNPSPLTQQPQLGAAYQPPDVTTGSVGGNVANAPAVATLPQPGAGNVMPGQGNFAQTPAGATGQLPPGMGGTAGALGAALQGIKAAAPQVQTVRTPDAPKIAPVPQSHIINTLASLGIGPQQAVGMGLFRR